jgi:type IV pilus assembly protein PilQ
MKPEMPFRFRSAAIAVGLIVGALPVAAQDVAPSAISDIRQETAEGSTRLIVECDGPMAYTYYSPDPLTLVVDIPGVDSSALPSRIEVGTHEVESLRLTQMQRADGRSMARVEVRLASLVPYQIFSKDRQLHLLFERAGAPAHPAQASVSRPEPAGATAAAPTVAAPEPLEPSSPEPVQQVAVDLPAPPAVVLPSVPASRLMGVSHGVEGETLRVSVQADGLLDYQEFFLGNPDRLVFDFMGVSADVGTPRVEVGAGPVQRIRIAQFSADSPRVARMVVDLQERTSYHVVPTPDGLDVVFGEGEAPGPTSLAAMRPLTPPAIVDPYAAAPVGTGGSLTRSPLGPDLPMLQEPALPPEGPTVISAEGSSGDKWTGHRITLDFKDGDLQDIFRLFSDITGLNLVLNPGISGRVTLMLRDVPWDQALSLILKVHNLGQQIEGNVLRIAPLATFAQEETARRQLAEEQALAGELVTERFSLSYATAGTLQPTIEKVALSSRGTITLDARTNTMIISDLERNIASARELIDNLDLATPQVEIESRIVVTSRNFTRDIGVQWGFSDSRTPGLGNTTNRAFPNAVIINGQGVPSTGGLPADQGALGEGAGLGTAGRGYAVNLPASGFTSAIGMSLGNIIGSFNLDAALTALERQGRGRLLSSPKITTQNNQAAEIKQGVQIPIQTVANNTVTVQFQDAVLTLKVTPQITAEKTVILAVEVENNAADFANLVQGIPPINTQSAKTNVLVADGDTAVIGGIYQSQEQTTENTVPFFSKIPVLGFLFRNNFVTTQNNELLIFITPRIL